MSLASPCICKNNERGKTNNQEKLQNSLALLSLPLRIEFLYVCPSVTKSTAKTSFTHSKFAYILIFPMGFRKNQKFYLNPLGGFPRLGLILLRVFYVLEKILKYLVNIFWTSVIMYLRLKLYHMKDRIFKDKNFVTF